MPPKGDTKMYTEEKVMKLFELQVAEAAKQYNANISILRDDLNNMKKVIQEKELVEDALEKLKGEHGRLKAELARNKANNAELVAQDVESPSKRDMEMRA